jgi:hypothetical protein
MASACLDAFAAASGTRDWRTGRFPYRNVLADAIQLKTRR